MKALRITGLGFVLALLVFAAVSGLNAQSGPSGVWNKKTTINFRQPFEVPGGQTLEAGTYVFRLFDSMADRDIVQIFSQDQTHIYATVLAISDYRVTATKDTVITFEERAAGTPQAIKTWFHPNSKFGHAFVYPKARAVELAKVTNEPVPSMPTELEKEVALPVKSAEEAPAVALENAPITVEEPSGQETTVAEAFPPPAPTETSLPKTASEMPLIGLIGVVSIAAGIAVLLTSKIAS